MDTTDTGVRAWVAERRKALGCHGLPRNGEQIWGLALSGGGIRSAVFCLGLVRALARGGSLPRFDVMSTVSGGGYVGSALGKLFHAAGSAEDTAAVYAALEGGERNWFSWWLRANGRYLIPRGFKDTLFALASYLRNLVALHIELGVLALALAIGLAAVNIGVWSLLAELPGARAVVPTLPYATRLLPTLWLCIVPLMLVAVVSMSAYWTLPEPGSRGGVRPRVNVAMSLTALVALHFVRPPLDGFDRLSLLWTAAVLVAAGWGLAVPVAQHALDRAWQRFAPEGPEAPDDPAHAPALAHEAARNWLTRQLGRLGRVAIVLLGLGALDRLAWLLAFEAQALQPLAAGLVVATALLRAVLPRLVPSSTTAQPAFGVTLATVGNAVGYTMLAAVTLLWLMAFDKLLFVENAGRQLFALRDLGVAGVVLAGLCSYAWFTRYDFGFLNLSSLHNFYRARVTRGFLGAANARRFPQDAADRLPGALHALDHVPREPDDGFKPIDVDDVHGSDDVAMAGYTPHRHGGPVHLINVCVNQTSDPRGGLFNQDRRGLPMTIGPLAHVCVNGDRWRQASGAGALTLGRWAAISGAAFAPGLGQMTRGGVAALGTLSGLRLGYWWPSHSLDGPQARPARKEGKSAGLLRELVGNFAAERGAPWYLSDGGHYENTAALALLAERARLIVLADCGADPAYGFADLENLVRKARIDFEVEIEFLRPRAAAGGPDLTAFGTLDDLASPTSQACLALARVRYGADGGKGCLVLVKPNMADGMTADLVNFKRDHPSFPQETTTDQFFGEPQWESYYKLGNILGRHLRSDLLHDLDRIADEHFEADLGPASQRATGKDDRTTGRTGAAASSRLPSRIAGSAMATSLGLGAAATIGVSVWQALDGLRVARDADEKTEQAALAELSNRYLSWSEGHADSFGPLVATLLRAADHGSCSDADAGWIRGSQLAQCAVHGVRKVCETAPGDQLAGCQILNASRAADCLGPRVPPPIRYWGFEFLDPARPNLSACPVRAIAVAAAAVQPTDRQPAVVAPAPASAAGPAPAPAPAPASVSAAPAAAPSPAPPQRPSVIPSAIPPPATPAVVSPPGPTPAPPPAAVPPPAAPSTTAAAGTGAGAQPPPAAYRPCDGKTVYLQTFGATQRPQVLLLREPWRRLGAVVPRVDDVLEAARRTGSTPPRAGTAQTRTYFHDADSRACAEQLVQTARHLAVGLPQWSEPVALPPRLHATPGVIEVWVAPDGGPAAR